VSRDEERRPGAAEAEGPRPGAPVPADDDASPPRDPALPVHEVAGDLTPPHEVAREALARAKEAARAKGLRPGVVRRPLLADGPQRVHNPGGRDPQLVADVLANLLKARGWVEGVSVGGVVGRWPEVVGESIAAHCAPESFDDKVLVVRADSTAWATQVELLAPRLLEALAREVGAGVVEQVRVLGPGGPSFRRGRRSVQGRGARDTWG